MARRAYSPIGLILLLSYSAPALGGKDTHQPNVALAVEGGGLRAQGVATGIVAALSQLKEPGNPTLTGSGILDRFGILSSNSGGSWFMSSMIYSSKYQNLVEGMARSPDTAAQQYEEAALHPWLRHTGVTPSKFNVFKQFAESVTRALLGHGDEDMIFMICHYLASGVDWNNWVDTWLFESAEITPTMMLGNETVNGWANGKIWLSDHTVVIPGEPGPGQTGVIYSDSTGSSRLTYSAENDGLAYYLPAKFSIRIGDGIDARAPVNYLGLEDGLNVKLKYHATSFYSTESRVLGKDGATGNIEKYSGKLPVARVTAASSAFLGGVVTATDGIFSAAQVETLIGGAQAAPWIGNSPEGEAFHIANSLVNKLDNAEKGRFGISKEMVDEFADAQVHAVIDGAYSDNTGIANAIASGADEIVYITNKGANVTGELWSVLALFPGGVPPMGNESPAQLYPIFEGPNATEQLNLMRNKFHVLDLGDSHLLRYMSFGSFAAVTRDNTYFGISAGRTITVHTILVGSDLTIGFLENFDNYAKLVQEIMTVLLHASNRQYVSQQLVPFFWPEATQKSAVVV